MYMTIKKSAMIPPRIDSSHAMLNTQPPLFSTGVVDGSILIWATDICAKPMIKRSEPASAAGSLREVFIERILATAEPSGNREGRMQPADRAYSIT
jgi:hypothetical protein